jgi:uncharacterized protein YndB with AHSA1/START domain
MTREPDPKTVIVECDLAEPPEKVWKALTVPELLARWLSPNDIRPEVGRRFRLEPEIECEVLEAEPNRRLRLSWRERQEGGRGDRRDRRDRRTDAQDHVDSIVTFDLTETVTGGTHLRLVHEGFKVVRTRAPATQLLMAA